MSLLIVHWDDCIEVSGSFGRVIVSKNMWLNTDNILEEQTDASMLELGRAILRIKELLKCS